MSFLLIAIYAILAVVALLGTILIFALAWAVLRLGQKHDQYQNLERFKNNDTGLKWGVGEKETPLPPTECGTL